MIENDGNIHAWQERVADQYFEEPIKEILTELNQPASIGKWFIFDKLVEKVPEEVKRFSEKTVKACIFCAMKKNGYKSISKRKKCFWREDLV